MYFKIMVLFLALPFLLKVSGIVVWRIVKCINSLCCMQQVKKVKILYGKVIFIGSFQCRIMVISGTWQCLSILMLCPIRPITNCHKFG